MDERGRVGVERGVVVGTGGGRDLKANVYRPPAGTANGACVVLVHGGGWQTGDPTQLHGYGILLGRSGYTCVAPEYRLLGESPWPAQIHDVKAALRWVRANADVLGIDPERIVVEGNSAGAHLALLAAGTPGVEAFEGEGGNAGVSSAVAAAIAVYAPTLFNRLGDRRRGGLPFVALHPTEDDDLMAGASPLTHVTESFPPTMLVHGTGDEVVPLDASLVFLEALLQHGVPCDLHVYAEQPHAFDATGGFGKQVAAEMLLFLERYTAAKVSA